MQDALFVQLDHIFLGHDHVQLSGVDQDVPQDFEVVLDELLIAIIQPGEHGVFPDLDLKIELVEDFTDKASPALPAVVVGGSTLELEADVVFTGTRTGQGFHGSEVVPEP